MARFSGGSGSGSGAPGPMGPVGPEGDSAYEVAVANGFVGTEQEWLDSLGSGGTANIADFIFTDNEWNSSITLPGDKAMRIEAGEDSDLYITSGDDLYIQTVGEADDIFIQAADDIRFSTNNEDSETEPVQFWTMNSEGQFHLPGDGYIENPQSLISSSRVDTFYNNYLNDSSGLNNTEFIALPVDETTMWYVNNQGSFESQVLITFQDSTQAAATIIYQDFNLPAVIFQWQDGTRDKTFEETFPLNISVGYRSPSGAYTIVLDPADNGNDQRIVIDPTAPNHIHIRAGGPIDQSNAELILGGELANVRVVDWSHEVIVGSANAGTETTYNWNFNNNGVIYGPGDNGLTTFTKIYANSNDDSGENLRIGDDAWIGDVNVADHIGIKGIQNPADGGIIFGTNRTERISVSDGDMNFWMDGGMYIGPSESGNQIIKREDLELVDNKTLPAGGEAGYVLTKIDSTNYNATWADPLPVETVFTVNGGTLGTQPTFDGAPLFTGSYVKHGPMVHFQIQVDMDNITSFGTGQYFVDLPFPAKYGYQVREGCLHDVSTGNQFSIGGHVYANSARLALSFTASNGQDEAFDFNSPVALTTEDNFHISGSYIAAE